MYSQSQEYASRVQNIIWLGCYKRIQIPEGVKIDRIRVLTDGAEVAGIGTTASKLSS
jgi:hypothetical protein